MWYNLQQSMETQENKQLASLFNFQKKKEAAPRKQEQIDSRCQDSPTGSLNLSWLKLTPHDVRHLTDTPTNRQKCLASRELYLEFNQLQSRGVLELSRGQWGNLRLINLASNRISTRGAYYLTRGNWDAIESLGLMANQIMDEGVLHLQKGQWRQLTILILSSNNISDRAIPWLSLGDWPSLAWIDLRSQPNQRTRSQQPHARPLGLSLGYSLHHPSQEGKAEVNL